MTRTNLFTIFAPKHSLLFPQINILNENLVSAAEKLKKMVGQTDPVMHNIINKEINELLHQGNIISYEIFSLIKRLFIVPFDKETLNEIVIRIGENIESVSSTGRMINFSRLEIFSNSYFDLAEIVYLCTLETGTILNNLEYSENNRNIILSSCETLQKYDQRAREIYYSEILHLVARSEDFMFLTKNKNILEHFIRCVRLSFSTSEAARSVLRKDP